MNRVTWTLAVLATACGGSPAPQVAPAGAVAQAPSPEPGLGPWPACVVLASLRDVPPGQRVEDGTPFPTSEDIEYGLEAALAYSREGALAIAFPMGDEDDARVSLCPLPERALGADRMTSGGAPFSAYRWNVESIEPAAEDQESWWIVHLVGTVEPDRLYADEEGEQSFFLVVHVERGVQLSVLERFARSGPYCWRGCPENVQDPQIAGEIAALSAYYEEHPDEADGGAGTAVFRAGRDVSLELEGDALVVRTGPWTTRREWGLDTVRTSDELDLEPLGAWGAAPRERRIPLR